MDREIRPRFSRLARGRAQHLALLSNVVEHGMLVAKGSLLSLLRRCQLGSHLRLTVGALRGVRWTRHFCSKASNFLIDFAHIQVRLIVDDANALGATVGG